MRSAFLPLIMLQLLVLAHAGLWAQDTEIPFINKTLVPVKGIYRFSSFNAGAIVFRNGIITGARMNYNISFDEMHFISHIGDTLAVAAPASISFINLNSSRFYYSKGYLQVVDNFNGVLLGFKQVLGGQQLRKEGYGRVSLMEDVKTYGFFTGNGQRFMAGDGNEVQVFAKEYYFFGDADGRFLKTRKEYLYRQFPQHRSAISKFIKTHHSNFNKLDDLLELLVFCRQLK
jgi:hypothetical protein